MCASTRQRECRQTHAHAANERRCDGWVHYSSCLVMTTEILRGMLYRGSEVTMAVFTACKCSDLWLPGLLCRSPAKSHGLCSMKCTTCVTWSVELCGESGWKCFRSLIGTGRRRCLAQGGDDHSAATRHELGVSFRNAFQRRGTYIAFSCNAAMILQRRRQQDFAAWVTGLKQRPCNVVSAAG